MRFYFLLILVFGLLSACSLPGTQTESGWADAIGTGNTIQFQNASISISVPKNWTETKTSDIPSPKHGVIVTAYVSPDVKYGFSNNIIVMQDSLNNIVTSAKYSELNNLQTMRNYLEYTKLQDIPFTFSDAEISRLYVFEARYNQTTPKMQFIQTARVCGTNVYLLHVSLSLDKSPTNYIELLKSFQCK